MHPPGTGKLSRRFFRRLENSRNPRDLYGVVCHTFIMVKNIEMLEKFQRDFIGGRGRLSHEQPRKLFASMWREGVLLGVLPPADPLEGIEVDIRVARILNSCLTKPSPA